MSSEGENDEVTETRMKTSKNAARELEDPVKVLQLSQGFSIAETLEDDDDVSLIIPPTPQRPEIPHIIPSTPAKSDKSDENNASNEEKHEEEPKAESQEVFDIDDDDWDTPTQPMFIDLEDTEAAEKTDLHSDVAMNEDILYVATEKFPEPSQSRISKESDDWNLKLTATQPTQAFESSLDNIDETASLLEDDTTGRQSDLVDTVVEIALGENNSDPNTEAQNDATGVLAKDNVGDLDERNSEKIEVVKEAEHSKNRENNDEIEILDDDLMEDSDDEEIAPSQGSTRSLSMRACVSQQKQEIDEETPTLVADTEIQTCVVGPAGHEDVSETQDVMQENIPIEPGSVQLGSITDPGSKQLKEASLLEEYSNTVEETCPDMPPSLKADAVEIVPQTTIAATGAEKSETNEVSATQMLPPVMDKIQGSSQSPQKRIVAFSLNGQESHREDVKIDCKDSFRMSKYTMGTYSSAVHLSHILSKGISVSPERLKPFVEAQKGSSRMSDIFRVAIKNNEVILYSIFETERGNTMNLPQVEISPVSSVLSSSNSKSTASFVSTPSGELGDISSSMSSKSQGSTSLDIPKKTRTSQIPSSVESDVNFKTSTQNSSTPTTTFLKSINVERIEPSASQDDFQKPELSLSPIKSLKRTFVTDSDQATAKPKRSRTQKNEADNSTTPNTIEDREKPVETTSRKQRSTRTQQRRFDTGDTSSDTVNDPPKRPVRKKRSASLKKQPEVEPKPSRASRKDSISDDIDQLSKTLINKDENVTLTNGGSEATTSSEAENTSRILPGVNVMAEWTDGLYYPGIVQSQDSDGRWCVRYEDGATRTISETKLLKIPILHVNTSVMAMHTDGYYDEGIVTSHFREGKQYGYIVEKTDGVSKRYSRGSVILTVKQAQKLGAPCGPASPSSSIDLDNLVHGKRRKKSIQTEECEASPPKIPRLVRTSRKKSDVNIQTTESSANESLPREKGIISKIKKETKKKRGRQVTPRQQKPKEAKNSIKIEQGPSTDNQPTLETSRSLRKRRNDVKQEPIVPLVLCTAPPTRASAISKLFQDYGFLLSQAIRQKPMKSENDSDYTEDSESEQKDQFDKEELCKQIYSAGGLVLENFEESQTCSRKYIILLANTCLRTIKYFQCIAANIPCIDFHFVKYCISAKMICSLNIYRLPIGFSIVDKSLIEWHKNRNAMEIFKNLKIVVTAEKKSDFVSTWTPVLLASKADLVQKWSMPSFKIPTSDYFVNVVVTDSTCPQNVLIAAEKRKIPIVSSEWLIQCLISGQRLAYDQHPKFKYNYTP